MDRAAPAFGTRGDRVMESPYDPLSSGSKSGALPAQDVDPGAGGARQGLRLEPSCGSSWGPNPRDLALTQRIRT